MPTIEVRLTDDELGYLLGVLREHRSRRRLVGYNWAETERKLRQAQDRLALGQPRGVDTLPV